MKPRDWYFAKANALAEGWRRVFGHDPSLRTVVLALAVAIHETNAGDAWPGEHNWGAVQARRPTGDEAAALAAAGITPHPDHVTAARAALLAAGFVSDHVALHCDSSPVTGWYFYFFAAFDTDTDGAQRLVEILAVHMPACRAVLTAPQGFSTERALATAMYASHYYEGFHDPHQPGGADANIADYANALERVTPAVREALVGW